MKNNSINNIKHLRWAAALIILLVASVHAQRRYHAVNKKQPLTISATLAGAGINFVHPPDFKDIPPLNNDDFSFDYAMMLPHEDFEIWMQVFPLKQNWANYERIRAGQGQPVANPDSAYHETAKAMAAELSVDGTYFERNMPPDILSVYNADAGKTYLINLNDTPETRHYNYALVITIQKNHVGNLLAVCLANDKGPDFFKHINRLRSMVKFK